MNCSRIYNYIDTIYNIRSFLSIENLCAGFFKMICQSRFFVVRSGNSKVLF